MNGATNDDDERVPDDGVRQHDTPLPSDGPVTGDWAIIDAVGEHIEDTIGPVHMVFHEIVSEYVHVDVHHVLPSAERPYHVLVTSGMSERPMTTPPDLDDELSRAELLICLPSDWPLDKDALREERHYWPIRWLKSLARLPHEYATWLGYGHTVPNGDPAEPLAPGTALAGMLVLPPFFLDEDAHMLRMDDGRAITFWMLMPLYAEEMDLKLREGSDALLDRFDDVGVSHVVDPQRPNVAT